jgi:hypothetical protein
MATWLAMLHYFLQSNGVGMGGRRNKKAWQIIFRTSCLKPLPVNHAPGIFKHKRSILLLLAFITLFSRLSIRRLHI